MNKLDLSEVRETIKEYTQTPDDSADQISEADLISAEHIPKTSHCRSWNTSQERNDSSQSDKLKANADLTDMFSGTSRSDEEPSASEAGSFQSTSAK